jgi:site-specific recombinase XerC
MKRAVERFLRYLVVERNASPLTIKSYREDLTALLNFLESDDGNVCSLICVSMWRHCMRPAMRGARLRGGWHRSAASFDLLSASG